MRNSQDDSAVPSLPGAQLPALSLYSEVVTALNGAKNARELGVRMLAETRRLGVERIIAGSLHGALHPIDYKHQTYAGYWRTFMIRHGNSVPADLNAVAIGATTDVTHHFAANDPNDLVDDGARVGEQYTAIPGVAFPIGSTDKKRYGVAFFGSELRMDDDAIPTLSFIAHFGFGRMLAIKENEGLPKLTEKQRQILQLASEGKTDKEIARELAISPHTVDKHFRSLRETLTASNRTAAIVLALRRGLIE